MHDAEIADAGEILFKHTAEMEKAGVFSIHADCRNANLILVLTYTYCLNRKHTCVLIFNILIESKTHLRFNITHTA